MKKKILVCSIGLVLLGGILIGGYYYLKNGNNSALNIDKIIRDNTFTVIDEDSDIDWSKLDSNVINLNNESVTITEDGVYTLSGKITNGSVTVNTDGNVKLILNDVIITNNSGPAIIIENAKNAIIELADGTVNTINDGSSYTNQEYDGCLYSKDDLILQGNGKLVVNANYMDGIVSNDDLKIVSGTYEITANDDAIRGKDSVYIVDGTFNIKALGDGIKSTNDTDSDKGNIKIDNGTFKIASVNDGIQAEQKLVIENGEYTITTSSTNSSDSAKGIKAGNNIVIYNGTFNINAIDDGIHSNGNIVINGGTYTINSKDDGVHADGMIEIVSGTFTITAAEGIEATYIKINDGDINISASDDGINAGNKSNDYKVTVEINGGNITIKMGQGDTDGIDSNGNIYINGGTVNITGQSAFDYDGEAKYNGGTIIVNGKTTNTITNQFAGGMMGGGIQQGGNNMQGNRENIQQDGIRGGNHTRRG